jgi:hypothetical protein
MSLGVVTNNHVEAENHAIKRSSGGVQPNIELDDSQKRIDNINSRKERRKQRDDNIGLSDKYTHKDHRDQFCEGIVDNAAQLGWEQFSLREKYTFCRVTAEVFYVKDKSDLNDSSAKTGERSWQSKEKRREKRQNWVVPKCERTRVVTIKELNGELVAVCTCMFFFHFDIMCRHMYCIFGGPQTVYHFHIRHWQLYNTKYKTSQRYTDLLKHIRDNLTPEGFFVGSEDVNKWPVGTGMDNLAFFERSLNNVVLKKDCYWSCSPAQHEQTMKILSANQVGHREVGIPSSGGVLTQEVSLRVN